MTLGLVSLIFLCSPLSSSTLLWNVDWTLPSVIANDQCVWCLVFFKGRSVCHSVAVVSPLLLSAYMEQWDLSLLAVCVLHLVLLWSVIHSSLPSPSKRHDKAVFCISSMWNVSSLLFEFCILWEGGRAVDCARKARVTMQRTVLVSVVSIWPQFWPKASSVLKADAQSCCPLFLGVLLWACKCSNCWCNLTIPSFFLLPRNS